MKQDIEFMNCVIEKTDLGREDHGIPTAMIRVKGGGCGTTFGGFDLRWWGYHFIDRVLDTVGCDRWEKLIGKPCRVKFIDGTCVAIGHFTDDKWFEPRLTKEKDAAKAEREQTAKRERF